MSSPWLGVTLAVVIGAVLLIVGKWGGTPTLVSLVLLAFVGAVFPPLALVVGGMVLLLLVMLHGQTLLSDLPGNWPKLQAGFKQAKRQQKGN